MATKRRILILLFAACGAMLWAFNSSLLAPSPSGEIKLIAHRGAHQTFPQAGVEADTCTAARIETPSHPYLENTIAGIEAAFRAGADVVELDVHLTPDGAFAVFHDLDVGYGYTADGGRTYPFRGKGVGAMPTLEEVFAAHPDGQFLVNFKSRRPEEGTALARLVEAHPDWRGALFGVYGGSEPTEEALAAVAGLRGYTAASAKACLLGYLATGWFGRVPQACRGSLVPVPINYAPLLWGWPARFVARMSEVGSDVVLLGPYDGGWTAGIDDRKTIEDLAGRFAGYVWTNRILEVGPSAAQERVLRGSTMRRDEAPGPGP